MPTPKTAAPSALATKFIVSSSALLARAKDAAQFVTRNPVVPILENLLLQVHDGQLTLTGSDLETTFTTAPMPVESRSAIEVALPAQLLRDTLSGLPDQPITFALDEDTWRATLHSANGQFKFAGENPADFPRPKAMPQAWQLELPAPVLLQALRHTLPFVSSDELRPAMCGVLFQLSHAGFTCAATDGHRLTRHRARGLDLPSVAGPRDLIVPRAPLQQLVKLASGAAVVTAAFSPSAARFELERGTLHTRLIDERYPDYENVIPISNPNLLAIDRAQLQASLRRLAIYANRTTHQVRFRLAGGALTVSAEDLDFDNAAEETLPCQYDGDDLEIGFNAKFLLEALGVLDCAEVSLAMSTPNRAGVLQPLPAPDDADVLLLVMPVMLNNYI